MLKGTVNSWVVRGKGWRTAHTRVQRVINSKLCGCNNLDGQVTSRCVGCVPARLVRGMPKGVWVQQEGGGKALVQTLTHTHSHTWDQLHPVCLGEGV